MSAAKFVFIGNLLAFILHKFPLLIKPKSVAATFSRIYFWLED